MTPVLQLSDNQESDTILKMNDFAKKLNMRSVRSSLENLVDEIKPVFTFKDGFGNGDNSK